MYVVLVSALVVWSQHKLWKQDNTISIDKNVQHKSGAGLTFTLPPYIDFIWWSVCIPYSTTSARWMVMNAFVKLVFKWHKLLMKVLKSSSTCFSALVASYLIVACTVTLKASASSQDNQRYKPNKKSGHQSSTQLYNSPLTLLQGPFTSQLCSTSLSSWHYLFKHYQYKLWFGISSAN